MTIVHQKYLHLQNSISDLNEARNVLQAVRESKSVILRGAAFKYALIAYSRPYTASRGPEKVIKLEKNHIPEKFAELHSKIINARHKIHAHTDRDIQDTKLNIKNLNNTKIIIPISNAINDLEGIEHIDSIINLIELTLDSLIEEESKLLDKISP